MSKQLQLLGSANFKDSQGQHLLTLRRPSALLIYLAYKQDWVTREELMYLFDPDVPNKEAARKLRIQLYRAKQLIWSEGLEIDKKQVRYLAKTDTAGFWKAIHNKDWKNACQTYQGELLKGLHLKNASNFQIWLEHERNQLVEAWMTASLNYAEQLKEQAYFDEALSIMQKVLNTDPFNEKVVREVMVLNRLKGERKSALNTYERFNVQLQSEFGLEPQEETRQLAFAIQNTILVQEKRSQIPYLPLPKTPFISREFEMADMVKYLKNPDCHLISLVGPGGCGKTRLALQAALELNSNYKEGSQFISLAALKSSSLIPTALANHFELNLSGQAPVLVDLKNYLREKELLLVIDNLEHLLDDLSWLKDLLEHCPHLYIITTSRERLKLPTEYLINIQGLPYTKTELKSEYEALKLFKETAKRVGKTQFSAEELNDASAICKQVEGNPLALELAASWLRALSVKELKKELQKSFDVLTESYRNLVSHHENPRAVFHHSWHLLSQKEQQALASLSIFPSSFSLEAAKEVTGVHLPILFSLIDKSLLKHQERYSFHELIHYYAKEKLDPKKRRALEKSYISYYTSFIASRENALRTDGQFAALAELSENLDNIRTFWNLAVEHKDEDALNSSLAALVDSYSLKSYFLEGEELLAKAAECIQKGIFFYRLQARRGRFLMRLGQYDKAKKVLKQSLEPLEKEGLFKELAGMLLTLGTIARNQGNLEASETYYRRGLSNAKLEQDKWQEALAINNLGIVFYRKGNAEKAKNQYEISLTLFRKAKANWAATLPINNLGILSYLQGNFKKAKRYFGENILLFESIGDTKGKALSLSNLGSIAYEEDNYSEAKTFHLQSLNLNQDIGERWAVANDLANLGFVCTKLAEFEESRDYLVKALQRSHELNIPPMMLYSLVGLAELEYKRNNKKSALELFNFVQHHEASNKAVKDRCENILKALKLTKTSLHEAKKDAQKLRLEAFVQTYLMPS